MFYSETLLAKTGPLARVWLAANLERKLTKQNVLSSNLEDNVKSIIAPGRAPMALRLSGQLLLGVVKIYSRKARYLLDDCSDALAKIKMAFRPGNVDMPANQAHAANRDALVLPDALTELDLFAPLPDPEELLRDDFARAPGNDPTLLDFGTSQLLSESQTPRREKRTMDLDNLDLDLDFGTPVDGERSIEIGRRAHSPLRRDEPSLFDDDIPGLAIDMNDDTTLGPLPAHDMDVDMDMPNAGKGIPDDTIAASNAAALARLDAAAERTFLLDDEELNAEVDEETTIQHAQRAKRRRILPQDSETQLHNSQIKRQQEDRSAITRPPTFLPRDPLLLQLMEMQRAGNFVSSIMGDGRMAGWAPELRGILSLEVVRKAGLRKRKRDSGVADVDVDEEEEINVSPELDIDHGAIQPMSDGIQPPPELNFPDEEQTYDNPAFDTTEAPLLHPSQTGPVSLGTKTAVHLLREFFAPNHPSTSKEPPTPSKRVKAEASFVDLCPEASTSREEATKLFFELLVLGSKDAVAVVQEGAVVGEGIRVRGKRGLWGDWAEMGGRVVEEVEGEEGVEV